jgi:CheY-like chemotaxis protein
MAGATLQNPTTPLQYCFPYFLMSRDEHIAFRVSSIRTKFTTYVFGLTWMVYPFFIFFVDQLQHRLAGALMLITTWLEIWAILRGSDRTLIYTTRILQTSLGTISAIFLSLHWMDMLGCETNGKHHGKYYGKAVNCTAAAVACSPEIDTALSVMHATLSFFTVFVLLPILFLVHLIPVPVFVLPVILVGCIDVGIASTFAPTSEIIVAALGPLLAGVSICVIGYRADFRGLKTWQDVKQKEAWLASVAHNIGTPLMTINFAASAMWDMTKIEDTRLMLKRQRVAVDYLRSVYSTVMYRKDGRNPVGKRQRFKIKTLQQACEDVTTTYGSSMFPDVVIEYYVEEDSLPDFIVSDFAKIQQCVVNLVSNAQKHCKDGDRAGACAGVDTKSVTVRFLMDETLHQLRIEVYNSGKGVNDSLVKGYFRRNGTGLGSVGLMMESMGGAYGGHRGISSSSSQSLSSLFSSSQLGSTFFIAVPLCDDVEMDVVHDDDDHATLSMSVEQRQREDLSEDLSEEEKEETEEKEKEKEKQEQGKENGKELLLVDNNDASLLEDSNTNGSENKETASEAAEVEEAGGKYKLLLVEDMLLNRAFIRLWMLHEFSELRIVDASNGKEALEQLQIAAEAGTPFDMVLMDISMPVMDGFACLEEMTIMYDGEQNRPPTIAITTGTRQRKPGTGAKFDQWWDKTDQSAMLSGMKELMCSIDAGRV